MHRTKGVATIEKEYDKKVSEMKSLIVKGDISTRAKALNLYSSDSLPDPDVLSWLRDISDETYNAFYQQNFKSLTEIESK